MTRFNQRGRCPDHERMPTLSHANASILRARVLGNGTQGSSNKTSCSFLHLCFLLRQTKSLLALFQRPPTLSSLANALPSLGLIYTAPLSSSPPHPPFLVHAHYHSLQHTTYLIPTMKLLSTFAALALFTSSVLSAALPINETASPTVTMLLSRHTNCSRDDIFTVGIACTLFPADTESLQVMKVVNNGHVRYNSRTYSGAVRRGMVLTRSSPRVRELELHGVRRHRACVGLRRTGWGWLCLQRCGRVQEHSLGGQ